jgi:hypothetical protein
MADPPVLPRELTAPAIQRLARKGLSEQLSEAECAELCACVVFHVDEILRRSRIPRVTPSSVSGADGPPG